MIILKVFLVEETLHEAYNCLLYEQKLTLLISKENDKNIYQ